MASMIVETIDSRTVVVLHRTNKFITLLPVSVPAGTQVEVITDPDPQYAEYDVHRVTVSGMARFERIASEFSAIRQPGEALWQTLERLGIDEENLLP